MRMAECGRRRHFGQADPRAAAWLQRVIPWMHMLLSEVYADLGSPLFEQLVRSISIGKLKTFQVYESFKVRAHLTS